MKISIEMYGHYYYRDSNHMPKRITIVAQGKSAGFYECVYGHWRKEEIAWKKPETFLIHVNRITL